jgi:hypothetical protein
MSDMAGGLGSRPGRSVEAVESSGSERDTMELAGSATLNTSRLGIARVDGDAARVAGASTGRCE